MTKLQFDYLSERLENARRRLVDCRHGGVVITGDALEETISNFSEFVKMAKKLECEISRREWNARAQDDLRKLVNEPSALVLDAMRCADSNVIGFPGSSPAQGGQDRSGGGNTE